MEIRVEVAGPLADHVRLETGEGGTYADAGEYVRDLIRRDRERVDAEFAAVRSELREAFAAPEASYVRVTADDVLTRIGVTRPA